MKLLIWALQKKKCRLSYACMCIFMQICTEESFSCIYLFYVRKQMNYAYIFFYSRYVFYFLSMKIDNMVICVYL